MKWLGTLVVVVALAAPATAQEATPFQWETHAAVPARISDALVGVNLGLDAVHAFRAEDRHERVRFGCRTAVSLGIAEGIKLLVHRTRPNGADRKSFFSEHTALATSAASTPLTASFAMTVAWGRQAAGAHYGSDVAVGASVGLFSRWICR